MTISLLRMPMFGFFGLGFLFFCAILAVAVWLAFKSGEKGTTKLGGFAGCAIALALLFVAGTGALGCTTIALLNTPNELVRRGPVKSFEFHWDDSHGSRGDAPVPVLLDEDHAIGLRIELQGTDPGEISRWLRDHTEGDIPYTIVTGVDADGTVTYLDVSLPCSRRDLRRLREDMQRDFPNLRLPASIKIQIKGEDE